MPTIDGPRLEDSVSPVKTFPENFSPLSVNARYFAWLRAKISDVRRGALGQIGQDPQQEGAGGGGFEALDGGADGELWTAKRI